MAINGPAGTRLDDVDLPLLAGYPGIPPYPGTLFGHGPDRLIVYRAGNVQQLMHLRDELEATGMVTEIHLQKVGY